MQDQSSELYQRLMEQAGLTSQDIPSPFFEEGKLEKVIVQKQRKSWKFHLHYPEILSFNVYTKLKDSVRSAFASIAEVSFNITTDEKQLSEKKLKDYWLEAVQLSEVKSPICDGPFRSEERRVGKECRTWMVRVL